MSSNSARQLVQQQLRNNTTSRLVNSPHAKYDSKGQLKCIVCGCPVKSAIVWQAHIAKKSHLQNLENLQQKQKQLNNTLQGIKRKAAQPPAAAPPLKKTAAPPSDVPSKKPTNIPAKPVKIKGILKGVSSYSSSDSEEEQEVKPTAQPNGLPAGFFDNGPTTEEIKKEEDEPMSVDDPNDPEVFYRGKETKPAPAPKINSAETLPEGFFDDPVQDAKVRKVEYVNKDEAEWDNFMKEVSAAETESRQIIDEDAEAAAVRNQMLDVEERMQLCKKIITLDKALKTRPVSQNPIVANPGSDSDSDDELSFSTGWWRNKNFSL